MNSNKYNMKQILPPQKNKEQINYTLIYNNKISFGSGTENKKFSY